MLADRSFLNLWRFTLALLVFALSVTVPRAAFAQCEGWQTSVINPWNLGAGGTVYAMLEWDPDGAGPLSPWLVIAGAFNHVGTVYSPGVAAWDGQQWRSMNNGLGSQFIGYALTVYNGELIVGGRNRATSTSPWHGRVFRWTGTSFSAMGVPLQYHTDHTYQEFTYPPVVYCLAVFNGELYAGGRFTRSSVAPSLIDGGLVKWTGTQWVYNSPMVMTDTSNIPPYVGALQVYGGSMFIGGHFASTTFPIVADTAFVARIDSAGTYSAGGLDSAVECFQTYNGTLYAGGHFTENASGTAVNHIARWTGTNWLPLGAGLNNVVWSMSLVGAELAVGGAFTNVGGDGSGIEVPGLARWNNSTTTWSSIGHGVATPSAVHALTTYAGILACGGTFNSVKSNVADPWTFVRRVTLWNGNMFLPLESVREVHAFTQVGSRLVVGGSMLGGPMNDPDRPDVPLLNNIVAWDGYALSNFGAGTNGRIRALSSAVIAPGETELVAAGEFTMAGDVSASRIARWVESTASGAPEPAWQPMGMGFGNTVYALTRHNGWTVAAGAFTNSGGTSVPHMAVWDQASGTWSWGFGGANGTIRAMKSFTTGTGAFQVSNLVIGGEFTAVDGITRNRIARRTDTSTAPGNWFTMGDGFNDTVHAIERHNGEIYAGGAFTESGATPLNRIARWTGSAWVDVGGGFNNTVFTLYSHQGSLYAGGWFTQAGGLVRQRIARWDGSSWEEVRGGADNGVFAFGSYQSELHAGGAFRTVRNGAIEAPGWGRFSLNGVPWVYSWSASSSTKCGNNRSFSTSPPSGYSGFTRQWYKDGQPLSNGPTGYGSAISGAQSESLLITSARHQDAGEYVCIYSNDCGESNPHPPIVFDVFGDCCPADINGDGVVNVIDLLAVISAWGPCADPEDCPADIMPVHIGDGLVNVSDLLAVISAWGSTCP